MKVTNEKTENRQAFLTVEMEPDEVEESLERSYYRLAKKTAIPGFRKGKAPRAILERYIGKESLLEDALNSLLPEAYEKAKGTIAQMNEMLNIIDIELAGIREKLGIIEQYRESGKFSKATLEKLEQMFVEQMIELRGAEARKGAVNNLRDRFAAELGFWLLILVGCRSCHDSCSVVQCWL